MLLSLIGASEPIFQQMTLLVNRNLKIVINLSLRDDVDPKNSKLMPNLENRRMDTRSHRAPDYIVTIRMGEDTSKNLIAQMT